MRNPLILDGGGSCSEVRIVCYNNLGEEIGNVRAPMGVDEKVHLPLETEKITVIPIVDLDI